MEAVRARLLLDFAPPPRRGKVIATALAISVAFHAVLFTFLGGEHARETVREPSSIDVEILKVEPPPPPPPPPEPEVLKDPVKAEKPKIVEKQPEPLPPPPANQEPPPEPPAKPPPIRVGISLQSTTEGGSVALGTGNTLYGKADSVAGDPSQAQPYAAPDAQQAPFVPSSRVTSLPKVRREAPKIYPEAARNAGVEGQVVARIRIDEEGKVVAVKIVEGPGYGLEEAARKALFQFLFDPARVDGKPVATEISYVYTFLLD